MKNFLISIIILGLTVFAGFSIYTVFYSKPSEKSTAKTIEKESPGSLKKTNPQRVRSRISYFGRIDEAKKLIDNEYYSLAAVEINEAIKDKPDFIEPYRLLAEIYLRTADAEKLENLIINIEKNFPNHPEILVLKTRQLIIAKKFDDILSLLKTSKEIPPALEFYQAALYALQNDHETALKTLEKLSTVEIHEKTFTVNEGGISELENDEKPYLTPEFAKKINDFKNVYTTFTNLAAPKNAHLFASIAKVLAENNEGLLAREFSDVAIKEDVNYIDGWILRGYSNLLLQNHHSAEQDLRQAYELDPLRPETQYFLALSLYEQKKYEEASLFFEKALEYEFEFSAEVRWKLLGIFATQKKYEKVLKLYKELLDYDTDPQKFVSAVHTAVDLLKKPNIALEFSQILMEKNPKDPFALNIHGWALIANKKHVEAKTVLEKALELDAENPRTYLNLGLLYEAQHQFSEAKEMYKKSYEFGKDNPEFLSIANLAVEKHNRLLSNERPEVLENSNRPENSP